MKTSPRGNRIAPMPDKVCAACGRPFAWRRKWARDWAEVKYCSDACRSGRYDRARAALQSDGTG